MKTDIEIAQANQMEPITAIAARAGIEDKYLEQYGKYKAKVDLTYLNETDKPVLLLQGGMDFQVLASDDYLRFQTELKDRPNVRCHLFDGLNHLFVKGVYNDILKAGKEYKQEQHIGPEVMDAIADFILSPDGES